MDREVDVYFFHIPMYVETDVKSWKWIYYKPARTFVIFPGLFEGGSKKQNIKFLQSQDGTDTPENICENDEDCVAIIKTANISTVALVDYLDMDNFTKRNDKTTMVKIKDITEDTKIEAYNPWNDIDTCCPMHKKTNTKTIRGEMNDTMPRISCNISKEEFLSKYVRKREPVMLVNCTKEFFDQRFWTFEKLLSERDGKLKWSSDFESTLRRFKRYKSDEAVSGNFLKNIIENNGTVRVFDQLGRRKHTSARRNGLSKDTDKMHLFNKYSKPHPVPTDYYDESGILTDYQWLILSMKDTGDIA